MRPALGYLTSVAVASFAMATAPQVGPGFFGSFAPGLFFLNLTVWGIAFVLTGVWALLPFILTLQIARCRGLNSAQFFLASACVTAVLLCVVAAFVAGSDLPSNDPERLGFSVAFPRFLPWFLAGGVAGGATFWLCSREALADKRDTETKP